jgi:hypothetical protein
VLARPDVTAVIDRAGPACLVFGLVLNLFPASKARQVIAGYADLARMRDELSGAFTAAGTYNHTPAEIAGFLAGLDLVDPGLVVTRAWPGRHARPAPEPGRAACVLGGVARRK